MTKYVALLLAAVVGCAKADGSPKEPRLEMMAIGDTVKLYVSWTAAKNATGYLVTGLVTNTNGTWAALPTNAPTTAMTGTIVTNSATADSGTFQVCIKSTAGTQVSAGSACTPTRQWRRLLPPPSVTFDSVIAAMLFPNNMKATFAAYGTPVQSGVWNPTTNKWTTPPVVNADGSVKLTPSTETTKSGMFLIAGSAGVYSSRFQYCPYVKFVGDTVALPTLYAIQPCTFFLADSLTAGLWHSPRPGQQATADAMCWLFITTGGTFPVAGNSALWQAPGVAGTYQISATMSNCSPAIRRNRGNLRRYVEHHIRREQDGGYTWRLFGEDDRAWTSGIKLAEVKQHEEKVALR